LIVERNLQSLKQCIGIH